MDIKVRYYSKGGNTKALANSIAKASGVDAISIEDKEASINTNTDILFIGGALYAYGIDNSLKEYISSLDASKIKKAVVFSTSWISKHSIALIKKALSNKGIKVEDKYIYYKNMPSDSELKEAEKIVKNIIEN